MSSINLENLVKVGHLQHEAKSDEEIVGLIKSGTSRLNDAINPNLSLDSQFDLAYNAAHSLALAALRMKGYRPKNRYIVFQSLSDTTDLGPEVWRVLAKCHDQRNKAEYEGYFEIDERLLGDLLRATQVLRESVHTSKL